MILDSGLLFFGPPCINMYAHPPEHACSWWK